VAARRYRSPRVGQPLKILLSFTLLKGSGPVGLPGKPRKGGRSAKCPNGDGGRLVDNGDGTSYCPNCGQVFDNL